MIDLATCPPPTASNEARELLAQFAATGNQQPFEEVVRRYSGMVFNVCLEVTGSRHDAEDATQAAFLSLAVQVRGGQQIMAIGPWLQQVARRLSLDIIRSKKRRRNREDRHGKAWETRLRDSTGAGNGNALGHNPESGADYDEMRSVLKEELDALPPKYRMPLILHYYGGLSRDEMVRELNCRANTLGVRLHRGRDMLGKRLAKRGVTLSGISIGLIMGEVVRSIVSDHLILRTAQAATLLSSGQIHAGGLVSAQVLKLAQSAGTVFSFTKVKIAALFTLLAGGAASAHTLTGGNWNLPSILDFSRIPQINFLSPIPLTTQTRAHTGPTDPLATNKVQQPAITRPKADVPLDWSWHPAFTWQPGPLGIFPIPTLPAGMTGPSSPARQIIANLRDNLIPPMRKPGAGDIGGTTVENKSTAPSSTQLPVKENKTAPKRDAIADKPKTPALIPNRDQTKPPAGQTDGIANTQGGGGSGGNGDSGKTEAPAPGKSPLPKPQVANEKPIKPAPQKPPAPSIQHQIEQSPIDHANKVDSGPRTEFRPQEGGGYLQGENRVISTDYDEAGLPAFEQLRQLSISTAFARINQGVAINKQVTIGQLGAGVLEHTAGTHTADSVYLGVIKSAAGLYDLSGGELSIVRTADPLANPRSIEIGTAGKGVFLLGNAASTGTITETGEGAGISMTVGVTRHAQGELRGWGNVSLTGPLINNGKIIADGHGQVRTLDLHTFSSVTHEHDNPDITRGWYAINGGRLVLPAIKVETGSSTHTWGGSNDLPLTLVNSARITLTDNTAAGEVGINLLALDHPDVSALPPGHTLIGAWTINQSTLSPAGGIDLLVRYDDELARQLGLDENVLKLWTRADGQWVRHDFDASFLRDPIAHTVSAHIDGGFDTFAVSAPEPGTAGLLMIATSLWAMRRSRNRAVRKT